MKRRVLLLTCSLFFITLFTHAQITSLSATGLDLTASSDNPVPGQQVTITARSFSADINTANIIWVVNGKTAQSGIGLVKLDVTAPPLGKSLNIDVTAVTPAGRRMNTPIVVSSGAIDIITETDGYAPPFYSGKNIPVYENAVTTIAVPHIADETGKEYDPKTLVYQWKKDDLVLEDQSGYGKQAVTIQGDIIPRDYTLTLTAWPRSGPGRAEILIPVSYTSPTAQFYVKDPLYGTLFNTAVRNNLRIGSQKETGVRVVPFGINKPIDSLGDLVLTWMINGIEHTELAGDDSIVLRAPSDVGGSSNISLDIRNTNQILQKASASFSALFASPKNTTNGVTF
ncbi:MAG: hypothetical protein WCG07_00420 [Candidatus Taylorbacteria bacterium]